MTVWFGGIANWVNEIQSGTIAEGLLTYLQTIKALDFGAFRDYVSI